MGASAVPLFSSAGTLEPGFHDMTLDELAQEFCFSRRRQEIISGLRSFFKQSEICAIALEIWIDGSFVESIPDPGDIDIVMILDERSLTPGAEQEMKQLSTDHGRLSVKEQYTVDPYWCVTQERDGLAYWQKWFGRRRDGALKGLVRIKT
jgi:hypothetical protein